MKRAVRTALRAQIAQAEPFKSRELGRDERHRLVELFLKLFEGLYAHLPQKRASFGIDPVQQLRLLRQRLETLSDDTFHRSLIGLFAGVRDAHTRYVGPTRREGEIAFLPFLVERYVSEGASRYIVSKVFTLSNGQEAAFKAAGFVPEVEITHWNGVRIDRAVEIVAEREPAARPDARRARALETLTLRPLRYCPPPDEEWVDLTFTGTDGKKGSVRLEWRFAQEEDRPRAGHGYAGHRAYAGDPAAEAAQRVKKMLFAPDAWYADARDRAGRAAPISFRSVETEWGTVGYLRLWSFDVINDDVYLSKVTAALNELPREGLIVDLRGNSGGLIWAAERLLQFFTPNLITPSRFAFAATDLTRMLAEAPGQRRLEAWRSSLDAAVSTGELYSRAVPLTSPQRCNDVGQIYPGPVVAVIDARTYSSGDLFAAGFADHRIGPLVSVDEASGAGGANVWFASDVIRALHGTEAELGSLPPDVGFSISVRRAFRSGGSEIEDVGVRGQFRHDLTRTDLTEGNRDLIDFCARILSTEYASDLDAEVGEEDIRIVTKNLATVEMYVDDRPSVTPKSVSREADTVTLPLPAGWSKVEVRGYAASVLRQRRIFYPRA